MMGIALVVLSCMPSFGRELRIEFENGSTQRIQVVAIDGREYVLIGEVASAFDMEKLWDAKKKSVTLRKADREAILTVGSREATVDGRQTLLTLPPVMFKDMVALPLGDFTSKVLSPLLPNVSLSASEVADALKVAKRGVRLKDVRFHSYEDRTRLVLEFFDEPKVYQVSQDSADAISITVIGGEVGATTLLAIDDGVIKKVALTQSPDRVVASVALDVPNPNYRSFLLAAPPRLVLDVDRAAKVGSSASASSSEAPPTPGGTARMGGAVSSPPPEALRVKTLIIDPGHGGKDAGAKGRFVLEKEIVLDIAKRLRDEAVKNKLDVRVVMTREADEFVPLEERARIANESKGEGEAIFISIHANGSRRRNISGFETYFFDVEARGEGAEEMVEIENSFVSPEDGKKEISILSEILENMQWTAHIQQSSFMSEIIQGEMARKVEGNNRGVKQGPFFVLRNVRMPRVLVEVGFITNSWEEGNLRKSEHRQRIAESLFHSVKKYKEEIERRNGFIQ
jgi:N-acetylmuramoyl-L-alanine amidase